MSPELPLQMYRDFKPSLEKILQDAEEIKVTTRLMTTVICASSSDGPDRYHRQRNGIQWPYDIEWQGCRMQTSVDRIQLRS